MYYEVWVRVSSFDEEKNTFTNQNNKSRKLRKL